MTVRHHHKAKKRSRFVEYLMINIFVFFGIWLLSFIIFNVAIFNTFTQAFKDFTLTDVFYSRVANQDNRYDTTRLVIVDIEKRDRKEIGSLLEKLEKGKPKVIGLDMVFETRKDSTADSVLKKIFAENKNIVLPYAAKFDQGGYERKNNEYFQTASTSFVNVGGEQNEFSTIRYYYPVFDGKLAFTTAMMKIYDSTLAENLIKRRETKTEIRYCGNLQNFMYYTYNEITDSLMNTNALKDKIVLMGYIGEAPRTIRVGLDEDRFFTPMNPRLSGRSLPDMYGVVIHANILRMALDKDYILRFPNWLNWVIAFALSWILMPFFVSWYVHKAVWFHLFTLLIQLLISILFMFFTIFMYAKANVKIESSAVLVSILLIGDFLLFYDHLVKFMKYKLKWKFHSIFFEGGH